MRENSLKVKKRPLRISKAIKTGQLHIKKNYKGSRRQKFMLLSLLCQGTDKKERLTKFLAS